MKKYNLDITPLKKNDKVRFVLPYLDGELKFKGEVIAINSKTLEVRYETCIGEQEPYKINILTTEIPYSFLYSEGFIQEHKKTNTNF